MSEPRWERVKALFALAVDVEATEREQFVRNAASDDWELCKEVLSLLRAESHSPPLINPLFKDSQASIPNIGPYRLIEQIGQGGMGVVYRASDERRQGFVALKTLQRLSAVSLSRFKQEFRSFSDIRHHNLVALYDLLSVKDHWCFTMELVEGVPLTHFLARNGTALRELFAQLTDGVAALHVAGRLHRDLKPSNVLVTADQRLVILDFGLGAELDDMGQYETTEGCLLGSVAYMSPEQATGGPIGVASDWYSVGVMLFQALTGRLPFDGNAFEILDAKRTRESITPESLVPDLSPELAVLCNGLLKRDPFDRLGEKALRAALQPRQGARSLVPTSRFREMPFVGRKRELAALQDAYLSMRGGVPVVVFVNGDSGSGKTALVQRFLDDTAASSEVIVLRGRCHEQESVPYKALDSLVDSIARYLRHTNHTELQSLLPRDIRVLARVFPVLSEIPAVIAAPFVGIGPVDSQELRRRAASALRELLARIGDRRPLIVFIDDLQWGDVDSASVLTDILIPPDPPVFMVIGCYRREDTLNSPFLRHLEEARNGSSVCHDERYVNLGPLEPNETLELVRQLLETKGRSAPGLEGSLAMESANSPFLVYELTEHFEEASMGAEGNCSLALEDVLWARIERLPPDARRLLEIVAVAGRPVDIEIACRAASIATDGRILLPTLRAARLIRNTGGAQNSIEAYHDRVRRSVLSHLPEQGIAHHHRQLSREFLKSGAVDTERLAFHLHGAGDLERAGDYYAQAAAKAAESLAFANAATLYRRALELKPWSVGESCALRTHLADALSNAGHGADAAAEYLTAERHASGSMQIDLRRRAGLALVRLVRQR